MVYNGRPPKPEGERINRMPPRFETTRIEQDAEEVLRGPDLPPTAPRGVGWCEQTRLWWDNWRKSPQAKLMGVTDWDFHLDTAVLHNDYWRPPMVRNGKLDSAELSPTAKSNYLAEIRQRVAKFGATWEDRAKLRLEIETPLSEEENERAINSAAKKVVYDVTKLTKKAAEIQKD